MGIFSVSKVNNLLIQVENQLQKISNLVDIHASREQLRSALNELRRLTAEINYHFTDSGMARTAVYKFMGQKVRSWEILSYLTGIVNDLEKLI